MVLDLFLYAVLLLAALLCFYLGKLSLKKGNNC